MVKALFERPKSEHCLARADARLKILVACGLLLMILSYRGIAFPLMVCAAGLLLGVQMRVSPKELLLRFCEPAFFAVVLIVLRVFFTGKDELFSVSFFGFTVSAYREGLIEGLYGASRILGAVSVVAALGFSTPFTDIISALSWFRIPRGLTEILMFAYRYIFMLSGDAWVIYHAQKNRLGYSNLRRSVSSFGVLAGSLTLKALEHSQNTAIAMAQRGYDGNVPKLDHKPFKSHEIAVSVFLMLIMVLLWKI